MIKVDSSHCSHLAACSCGWRSDITASRAVAWNLAANHETACHTTRQAAGAAAATRYRSK